MTLFSDTASCKQAHELTCTLLLLLPRACLVCLVEWRSLDSCPAYSDLLRQATRSSICQGLQAKQACMHLEQLAIRNQRLESGGQSDSYGGRASAMHQADDALDTAHGDAADTMPGGAELDNTTSRQLLAALDSSCLGTVGLL